MPWLRANGDDVVHDEEVAREVLGLDHRELGLDALPVGLGEFGVLDGHRIPDQLPQPRHRGVSIGHLLLRQRGLRAPQRECELVGERDGALDGSGIPGEPVAHLASRSQVRGARGRQPPVQLVEAAARPHGGDRRREVPLTGGGVVHIAGRDDGKPALGGQRGQRIVVVGVERVAVVDELDVDVARGRTRSRACQALSLDRRWSPSRPAPAAPHPCGSRSAPPSVRPRAQPARRGRRSAGPSPHRGAAPR